MPGTSEGGTMPYWLAMAAAKAALGLAAIRTRSISASCSRFVLARRFWNQILICVSVSFSCEENSARSAMLRYCLARNFFSRAESCCVVKGVRGLRLGLCFRSVPILMGPVGGFRVMSEMKE